MTPKGFLSILFCTLFGAVSLAQGASCSQADPFCTDQGDAFPASTNIDSTDVGPDYECLGSQPNPAWYYLQIATAGDLDIQLTNSANLDIDFICWGPFATLSGACNLLTSDPDSGCGFGVYPCGNVVDCSYSTASVEDVNITGAAVGQFYILLITNFSNNPTDIFANQISGSGATNYAIVTPCDVTNLTKTVGPCVAGGTYTLSGQVSFINPPLSGVLTVVVTNGTGTYTQTFNAPFTSPTSYSIAGIPGNGAASTVVAGFSADAGCTMNISYNAPLCAGCSIAGLTATPGPCQADLTYSLGGTFTFSNAPSTGTLTIVATNGTGTYTQTINPPFSSPVNYSIPGIPGDGANTTVTVVFTADAACNASTSYTSPVCIPPCDILTLTAVPGDCKPDNTFDLTGTFTFTESPATGTIGIVVTTPSGTHTQTFDPPFTDGTVYNYTIPSILANQPSATVSARFSADPTCVMTIPFTTPTCICETQASFNVNPTVMTQEGTTATMINSSVNAVAYKWFFGDGDSSNAVNPVHTFPSENAAAYTVELICTSVGGCTDTARMTVVVKEDILFYVPNSFTPGNDEWNNRWEPVFTSGFDAYNYELLVYNRWGETVFESHDATVGWDGTYKDKPLGEGIYTWVIRFKVKEEDKRKEVQGHVYLLR